MAFIGHPLVGDIKYNHSNFERDCAIVPRIFLHCLRMEFEDMGGSLFVAASDLPPDLQAALARIHQLSTQNVSQNNSLSTGFPGLAEILTRSQECSVQEPLSAAGTAESYQPRVLRHRCLNCGRKEEANCLMFQRGANTALRWLLRDSSDADDRVTSGREIAQTPGSWGPGVLWVPSELVHKEACSSTRLPDASTEELGELWSPHGVEWAWAFDGVKQNGWFRLHSKGRASTKWGPGTWKFLHGPLASTLLLTFREVEHALRLQYGDRCIFDMVSRRRLAFERSLVDECTDGRVVDGSAPACSPTIGWPDPLASMKIPPLHSRN